MSVVLGDFSSYLSEDRLDGWSQMQRIAGAEKALGGKCAGYGFDAPEEMVSDWNGGD